MLALAPRPAAALLVMTALAACHRAPHPAGDGCDAIYRPVSGQDGKDVMWLRSSDELVTRMLQLAEVGAADRVVDLGAGDGAIPIAAARQFGAHARGIEYNPDLVRLAQCHSQAAGVAARVTLEQGDIFKVDFSNATVVTMFLLPRLNLCLRHRLLAMTPGTRIVSNLWTLGDWPEDAAITVAGSPTFGGHSARLWIVPARVAGTWQLHGAPGADVVLTLTQAFQTVGGTAGAYPLGATTLRGDRLGFEYVDDAGRRWRFHGTTQGDRLAGTLDDGGAPLAITGQRQGPAPPAPWAARARGCDEYYPAPG
jgi:hypothetical protein